MAARGRPGSRPSKLTGSKQMDLIPYEAATLLRFSWLDPGASAMNFGSWLRSTVAMGPVPLTGKLTSCEARAKLSPSSRPERRRATWRARVGV